MEKNVCMFVNKRGYDVLLGDQRYHRTGSLSLERCPDDGLSGALTTLLCLEICQVCFVFFWRSSKTFFFFD